MVIVDDILFFPVRGLLFIFKEIHKAVLEESRNEAEAIRGELSRLHQLLESGQIGDAEFDEREKELLDRLDALESDQSPARADADAETTAGVGS